MVKEIFIDTRGPGVGQTPAVGKYACKWQHKKGNSKGCGKGVAVKQSKQRKNKSPG